MLNLRFRRHERGNDFGRARPRHHSAHPLSRLFLPFLGICRYQSIAYKLLTNHIPMSSSLKWLLATIRNYHIWSLRKVLYDADIILLLSYTLLPLQLYLVIALGMGAELHGVMIAILCALVLLICLGFSCSNSSCLVATVSIICILNVATVGMAGHALNIPLALVREVLVSALLHAFFFGILLPLTIAHPMNLFLRFHRTHFPTWTDTCRDVLAWVPLLLNDPSIFCFETWLQACGRESPYYMAIAWCSTVALAAWGTAYYFYRALGGHLPILSFSTSSVLPHVRVSFFFVWDTLFQNTTAAAAAAAANAASTTTSSSPANLSSLTIENVLIDLAVFMVKMTTMVLPIGKMATLWTGVFWSSAVQLILTPLVECSPLVCSKTQLAGSHLKSFKLYCILLYSSTWLR